MRKLLITIILLLPSITLAFSGLGTNLKFYYPFDKRDYNTSTTLWDRSGNLNTGTITGTLTKIIGKIGQAVTMNGTQFVDTGAHWNSADTSLTLSFWGKIGTLSTEADGITNYPGASPQNCLFLDYTSASKPEFFVRDGSGHTIDPVDPTARNDNKWHFLTGVVSGTTGTLYVDAVQVAQASQALFNGNMDSGKNIIIGGTPPATADYVGSIDDVRIYNRALSAAEVNELYREGAGVHQGSFIDSLMNALGL